VKNAFLKGRLDFLAGEEKKHQQFLEKAYMDRYPGKEVELPEKTIVPLPEIRIPDESVPVSEVLISAMEAEKAAQEFYNEFSERFSDFPEIKRMLQFFANMELSHYKILSIELEQIEKFEEYDDYWPMMHMGT
jgi:rubrerythrin